MKALSTAMLALIVAAMPIMGSSADQKLLQNKEGSVTYGPQTVPTTKLALNSNATLNDSDYAVTGVKSKATITMPDSSVITMGENSNVQMNSFSNAGDTNTAKFIVVGKVRFKVEHPAGAKANYTFATPTGQIAVRGTEGDILSLVGPNGAPAGLQVNVYALTNPALPVQVTLVNGQVFTLAAGQSLVVTSAAGALVSAVGAVSNTTFAPFTQLGAPANASSLGLTTTTATTAGAAAGTTAAAAGTTATAVTAAAVVGTAAAVTVTQNKGNSTPAPTPSPTPAPTSTSIPITIGGHPAAPVAIPAAPGGTAPAPANTMAPSVPGPPKFPGGPHPIGRPSPPVN